MFSFILSVVILLLLLTGTLFWWQYITRRKLPPGPMPLPIIGNLHLLGNLPHHALHKLSQKYGSIMSIRLGSVNAVIVSSPDAAKLFFGAHDLVFSSRPKIQASNHLYHGKGIVLSEYGPHWRSVRKLCMVELLSAVKINGFAGMRSEETALMVEEIRAASMAHEVVNLSEAVGSLVEGMTCRMLFGKKNDDTFVFKRLTDEVLELLGSFNLADYLPILAPFDLQGLNRRLKPLSNDLDEMLESLIKEHEDTNLQTSCAEMNFIDILLSLTTKYLNTHDYNLSTTIDKPTMKAILLDMVAGGIDTCKASTEWILSALIKNPRVMKELQRELQATVGDKEIVEETDLAKLSYLNMVVKESFRLYPFGPLLVPHESIQDIVINGYAIPKKTRVLVNVWAFGRDQKVWSEDWAEFRPERFVGREVDFRGPDFQLMPFGAGRRGCPGMNLGVINIGLAVSNLVHCFDWVLPNGMSPMDLDMNGKFGLTMPRVKPLLAIPTYSMGISS